LKVSNLSPPDLAHRLARGEFTLRLAPFTARIRSPLPAVVDAIARMYGEFPLVPADEFADFDVRVAPPAVLRRWIRPQVFFYFDDRPSFRPLPADQAYPMLEWGLNWCIAAHAHQFLIVHAAVIEKDGRAALLPAPPGSGKSTLCAGLVSRGWRLLSDELTLVDLVTGAIHGMARPINLKNASIEVIRGFWPDAEMTAPVHDTAKGTVALVRPPVESVRRVDETARPRWIVFPRWVADAPAEFKPMSKARTCLTLAEQAFNYDIHGRRGFEAVADLVDRCDCFEFSYGSLDDAVQAFADLAATAP
jgi:hypothetical protein